MRLMLTVLCICVLVGGAAAQEKPAQDPIQIQRVECNLVETWMDFNYGADPQGMTPEPCETGGGLPVWQWGIPGIVPLPPAPYGPNVWGTIIGGEYLNDSGEGLRTTPIPVQVGVNDLIELVHYVDIETNFDGGNMVVVDAAGGETILDPMTGYPAVISTSTSYYAWCVDNEPGWTGHDAVWTAACADLSPWDGQEISVRFDFGSDSSVTYPGWYLAGYVLGTQEPTATENSTWGQIKSTYR